MSKARIKANVCGKKDLTIRKDPIKEYQESIQKDGLAKIVALGSEACASTIKHWFSTGSLSFDRFLNGKGIPAGRLTEIFGASHLGKSMLLDHVLGKCQQEGGIAILIDTETARDVKFTRMLGVDINKLQVIQFDRKQLTIENIIDKIIETADFWVENYPETPVVIGFDSLGGTSVQDEIDKNLGAAEGEDKKNIKPGAAAKVLKQACRKLLSRIAGSKVGIVVINHEYSVINMGFGSKGKKRETYGGEAIRLAATYRIELFNLGSVKQGDEIIGREIGIKWVKNRFGSSFGQTSIMTQPYTGVNNIWDICTRLKEKGYIEGTTTQTLKVNGESEITFKGWRGLQKLCEKTPELFNQLVATYNSVFSTEKVEPIESVPITETLNELDTEAFNETV